jgi:hypothetical protein
MPRARLLVLAAVLLAAATCGPPSEPGDECECGTDNVESASCVDGECVLACVEGWLDCDGVPENGCESLLDSPLHCGGCHQHCIPSNGTATCSAGVCLLACDEGWADCNDDPWDGCETELGESDACD